MTDCIHIQTQLMDYIDESLSDEELADFLEHLETCPACKEELNIYYTVYLGLRQLDNDEEEIRELQDIGQAVEDSLSASAGYLAVVRRLLVARYAFYTVVFWTAVTAAVFMGRILMDMGII